jgi:hypothetical protein
MIIEAASARRIAAVSSHVVRLLGTLQGCGGFVLTGS